MAGSVLQAKLHGQVLGVETHIAVKDTHGQVVHVNFAGDPLGSPSAAIIDPECH